MTRISFRGAPSMPTLFLDYLDDWPRLAGFYPRSYTLESIAAFARERRRRAPAHLDRLCDALRDDETRWGAAGSGVEKLRAGAVAVVTGQQPGLFTGPLFAVYKAITAIKLARALEEEGAPAVPVFWIAAEDHDHEEIEWAAVVDRDAALRRFRVTLQGDPAAPVGWTEYGPDVEGAVAECLACLPDSEFAPEIRNMLEDAYCAGRSPVDAFARMMTRIFEGSELIVVNPLHPELKQLAAATVQEAVGLNDRIRAAALERSKAIARAGYHEQVRVDENFTGLFAYNGKFRQALKPGDLTGDLALSPNVLLRPVVQDDMFPTAAYVGGPAEIAYFAQAAAVYDAMGRTMPPIFPRISATLIEPRIARALRKYELELTDVFEGRDYLRRKVAERAGDVQRFDGAREAVRSTMESLGPLLNGVDPTLLGALETSQQKMLHQIDGLRTRFLNAEAKRNELVERQLDSIGNSLFPDKKLQERTVNVVSFLVRYGPALIRRLDRQLSVDSREHQVVVIE